MYKSKKKEIENLKFELFGNDEIVFHERDIRKGINEFEQYLKNIEDKNLLNNKINKIIENSNFTVISTVINKTRLLKIYKKPDDPYLITLKFCLERIQKFLFKNFYKNCDLIPTTKIFIESRDKNQNIELELFSRRIIDQNNYNFELKTIKKSHNSIGLQIADLIAKPISLHFIKPNQENRAFNIIKKKFYSNDKGNFYGYGLKFFPKREVEKL
ncbi:MAG: DUF3800 domain-containing protein [Malacoplasma sp.]|nr:DUF3800 domain-containing protein [Malacoplasma sp.]